MPEVKNDAKSLSQQRFSQFADRYVASQGHAKGGELELLIEMAQPQSDWLALDIATGGGHTALKFAPSVRRVIAADISASMLEAARGNLRKNGVTSDGYVTTDAERLAFASNTFDLVTCRIAPHHFPDCFKFVQECARVLKPGGMLLIQDLAVPEEERAGRYLDAFERLRDPSHYRMYSELEWRGMYLDADLTVEHTELIFREAELILWAETQDCTPVVIERLQVMLAQAPEIVREWKQPKCVGTRDATFLHSYILIMGKKRLG